MIGRACQRTFFFLSATKKRYLVEGEGRNSGLSPGGACFFCFVRVEWPGRRLRTFLFFTQEASFSRSLDCSHACSHACLRACMPIFCEDCVSGRSLARLVREKSFSTPRDEEWKPTGRSSQQVSLREAETADHATFAPRRWEIIACTCNSRRRVSRMLDCVFVWPPTVFFRRRKARG